MRWAWFALAVVALVLGVLAGLYRAGPESKSVTYTYTDALQTEGRCEMTAEAEEAEAAGWDKWAETGDLDDRPFAFDTADGCDYYAKYGAVWIPPVYERVPLNRTERTNAWERISKAITGD